MGLRFGFGVGLVLGLVLPCQGHGAPSGRPALFDKNLDDSCQSLDENPILAGTLCWQ
jgi:hypothetical protein